MQENTLGCVTVPTMSESGVCRVYLCLIHTFWLSLELQSIFANLLNPPFVLISCIGALACMENCGMRLFSKILDPVTARSVHNDPAIASASLPLLYSNNHYKKIRMKLGASSSIESIYIFDDRETQQIPPQSL